MKSEKDIHNHYGKLGKHRKVSRGGESLPPPESWAISVASFQALSRSREQGFYCAYVRSLVPSLSFISCAKAK